MAAQHHLDIGMSVMVEAELSRTPFVLPVLEELRAPDDRDESALVTQRERDLAFQPLLVITL